MAGTAQTTVDRFFACVQICQRLSTIANNMRDNVQVIQRGFNGTLAGSTLNGNLPLTQQAFRDLGTALDSPISGLASIDSVVATNQTAIANGLTALGVAPADANAVRANLRTWVNNLKAAVIVTAADVDTLVANVLANVPQVVQAF